LQTSYGKAGTLDFAAPEVYRGHLAETSDQYSLAITYYLLRTGAFPFPPPPGEFRNSYSYKRPNPDLSRVRRAERRVLERALDLEPANRWPSCTAMMNALSEALNAADPSPSDASSDTRIPDTMCGSTPVRGAVRVPSSH
jgi:serine/threonine protein kinase